MDIIAKKKVAFTALTRDMTRMEMVDRLTRALENNGITVKKTKGIDRLNTQNSPTSKADG